MENKEYYTPKIEDLFVGYECQINYPNEDAIWIPINLDNSDIYHIVQDFNNSLELRQVRTPYLNKEDIESLGWKYIGKSIDVWFSKEGTFDMSTFRVYKIILHYGLEDHKLFIYAEDQGTEYDLFKGKCTSINELRKIMSYLNIETNGKQNNQ